MAKVKEQWKDIDGYLGYYQVSNHGRVRSLPRIVARKTTTLSRGCAKWTSVKGKILTPCNSSKEYPMVILTKDNAWKTKKVHQLVGKYFVKNPHAYKELNHIDGNKWNCYYKNLEYSNRRENTSHSFLLGGKKTSRYTGVHWASKQKKWKATIKVSGEAISLGVFANEVAAAKAYRKALKDYNLVNKYSRI